MNNQITLNQTNSAFFTPRTKLKLSEIERMIRKERIIVPCPSRQTLIGMCEDGTFESVGKDTAGSPIPTRFGWLVFEESFWKWAQAMDAAITA